MLWGSPFTNMIIAGMSTAEEGANIANLLFSLALVFCGVLASPETLPGFWIFVSAHEIILVNLGHLANLHSSLRADVSG